MIHWYKNLYMDETVAKHPKKCRKRVEEKKKTMEEKLLCTYAGNESG